MADAIAKKSSLHDNENVKVTKEQAVLENT